MGDLQASFDKMILRAMEAFFLVGIRACIGGMRMSFRMDLLKEAVTWSQSLDDTSSKITARLEDKAQQTGGMAGLFLAAAFGFVKPESVAGMLHGSNGWAAFLLLNVIVIFLLCLIACLSVLWLRNTPLPLTLPMLTSFNEDLLRLPADRLSEEVQENYYRDRISIWEDILEKRKILNEDKAKRLMIAQTLLAAGMLAVSILLFATIRGMLL
jgi:MFS family permease